MHPHLRRHRFAKDIEEQALETWTVTFFSLCYRWVERKGMQCPEELLRDLCKRRLEISPTTFIPEAILKPLFENSAISEIDDQRYRALIDRFLLDLQNKPYQVTLNRMSLSDLEVVICRHIITPLFLARNDVLYIPEWFLEQNIQEMFQPNCLFPSPRKISHAWLLIDAFLIDFVDKPKIVADFYGFY